MTIRSVQDLINLIEGWLWRDTEQTSAGWQRHLTRALQIAWAVLRDIAEGRARGDTTTLADPNVVAALKEQYEKDES